MDFVACEADGPKSESEPERWACEGVTEEGLGGGRGKLGVHEGAVDNFEKHGGGHDQEGQPGAGGCAEGRDECTVEVDVCSGEDGWRVTEAEGKG